MSALRVVLVCAVAVAASRAAGAFTFSDGTTMRCVVHDQPLEEYYAPPGHPLVVRNQTGVVETKAGGYRLAWNEAKLKTLPAEVHDFIFFHECAHATVPTRDELVANCVGLKVMRAAGRAGFAVESRLSAFYGPGNEYWRKTLECANAAQTKSLPPPD